MFVFFFTNQQNAVNKQKRNLNQISVWCDHPLALKQYQFFKVALAHSF